MRAHLRPLLPHNGTMKKVDLVHVQSRLDSGPRWPSIGTAEEN